MRIESALSPCHRALAGKLHRPRFADDRDFDFAGVIQLLFNGLGDIATHRHRVAIGRLGRVGDNADLAAGLDGVGVFDAGEAAWLPLRALPGA